VDYEICAVMQHGVYHSQIHIVWMIWNGGHRCLVRSWTVDFWRGYWQWRGKHRACVHADEGYFEYSTACEPTILISSISVTFNVTCFKLFGCYIFNYEIMPVTLANTSFPFSLCHCLVTHLSASDSFTIMALYKFTYLLTYLHSLYKVVH